MVSRIAVDALEACKDILINEIYESLKETPGHRCDIDVKFLDQFDGDPSICKISSVYLKDDVVFVDYSSYDLNEFSDTLELFTVDTVSEVLSCL